MASTDGRVAADSQQLPAAGHPELAPRAAAAALPASSPSPADQARPSLFLSSPSGPSPVVNGSRMALQPGSPSSAAHSTPVFTTSPLPLTPSPTPPSRRSALASPSSALRPGGTVLAGGVTPSEEIVGRVVGDSDGSDDEIGGLEEPGGSERGSLSGDEADQRAGLQGGPSSRGESPTLLRRRGAIHRSPHGSPPGADDGSQRLFPAVSASSPDQPSPPGDAAAGPRMRVVDPSLVGQPARRPLDLRSLASSPLLVPIRRVVDPVVPPFWWDERRQALQSLTAPDAEAKEGTAAHAAGDKGVWVVYCGPPAPPLADPPLAPSRPLPPGPPVVHTSSTSARLTPSQTPLADPGCGAILSTSAAFFPPPPPDFKSFRSTRPSPAALGQTAARTIPTGGFVALEARGAGESTFDGLLERLRPALGGREPVGPRPAIVACRNCGARVGGVHFSTLSPTSLARTLTTPLSLHSPPSKPPLPPSPSSAAGPPQTVPLFCFLPSLVSATFVRTDGPLPPAGRAFADPPAWGTTAVAPDGVRAPVGGGRKSDGWDWNGEEVFERVGEGKAGARSGGGGDVWLSAAR